MADHGDCSKLDAEKHILLDESLLRLPYELSRNTFRTAHRQIEQSQTKVDDLLKQAMKAGNSRSTDGSPSPKSLVSMDQAIQRLQTLKRKLSSLNDAQGSYSAQSDARIKHLDQLGGIQMVTDVEYDRWSRTKLDRLMVDYMLRQGLMTSARALAKDRGIEQLVDIDEFENVARIEKSLREQHRVDLALTWCGENKQALKKLDSELEYHLRQQQYIELAQLGRSNPTKLHEAILHARKYLVPQSRTTLTISSAGCIAYVLDDNIILDPDVATCFAPDQWDVLADLFISAHHRIFCLPSIPLLHSSLTAGMSALKTPACHSKSHQGASSAAAIALNTPVCPICSTELNKLAKGVPFAMHSKSHVDDNPVVLPTGRIIGRERLRTLNQKLNIPEGVFVDPARPGISYQASTVRKVFIM